MNLQKVLFNKIAVWFSLWDYAWAHQAIDIGIAIHTTEKNFEPCRNVLRIHKLIGKSKRELLMR